MTTASGDHDAKPEQVYGETKHLLFTVVRSIPKLNVTGDTDIRTMLEAAHKVCLNLDNCNSCNSLERIERC